MFPELGAVIRSRSNVLPLLISVPGLLALLSLIFFFLLKLRLLNLEQEHREPRTTSARKQNTFQRFMGPYRKGTSANLQGFTGQNCYRVSIQSRKDINDDWPKPTKFMESQNSTILHRKRKFNLKYSKERE